MFLFVGSDWLYLEFFVDVVLSIVEWNLFNFSPIAIVLRP